MDDVLSKPRAVYARSGRRRHVIPVKPIRGRNPAPTGTSSSDWEALVKSPSKPESAKDGFVALSLGSLSARPANKSPEKSPEKKVAVVIPVVIPEKVEKKNVEKAKRNIKRKLPSKKSKVELDASVSTAILNPAALSQSVVSSKPGESIVSNPYDFDAEELQMIDVKSKAPTKKTECFTSLPDSIAAKLPASIPSTSSSQVVTHSVTVKLVVANPYDFDADGSDDEQDHVKSKSQQSSLGGSTSSQGSNASTGSQKETRVTRSKTSAGDRAFKKPALPIAKAAKEPKARPKARVVNARIPPVRSVPPPITKAGSFPSTPVKLFTIPAFKEPLRKVEVCSVPAKKVAFKEPAKKAALPPIPEKKPVAVSRAKTSAGKRNFDTVEPRTFDLGSTVHSGSPPKQLKIEDTQKSCSQPQKSNSQKIVGGNNVIIPVRKAMDDSFLSKKSEDIETELVALIKGLQPQHAMPVRCLNAIQLALKLINPGTMLYFFACEYSGKLFDYFKDAASNENLSLTVSAVVLVLSTDSLKINLDRKGLCILREILEKGTAKQPDKHVIDGVWTVMEKMEQFRRGRDIAKSDLTAPRLVIEAIVIMKLGSQLRWFIDEIRRQGILEYCLAHLEMLLPRLEQNPTMSDLKAVDRLIEFYYKVMHENKENSMYLCTHQGSSGVSGFASVVRLVKFCVTQLEKKKDMPQQISNVIGTILRAIFSNLINVIAHAELWRRELGHQVDFVPLLMRTSITGFADALPREKSQEIVLRSLLCLVNLTYNCEENCQEVMKVPSVIPGKDDLLSLAQLIKTTSIAAEASGDDMERVVEQYGKMIRSIDLNLDVTITDVLDKAGDNMEHYAIMSYTGILLSHLIEQNDEAQSILKTHLKSVFGSVSEGITVASEAIRRMTEFIADAKAENIHPLHELNAAVDALERYGYSCAT